MPFKDGSVASMQEYINADNTIITEVEEGLDGINMKGKSVGVNNSSGDRGRDEEEEYNGPSDSTLIARSLASKMRGNTGRNEEDDEPMTTAAVRELRKLQKEKVYRYTLLRVKFPDRVCIQGYFHLRHTLLDVYEWVRSCLRVDDRGEELVEIEDKGLSEDKNKKNPSGSDFFRLFELYTSPPRCVLHPYAKSGCDEESYFSTDPGSRSSQGVRYLPLVEAHLVPAALIHLTWGPDHVEHKDNLNYKGLSLSSSSSSSSSSASVSATSVSINADTNSCIEEELLLGRYLSPSLLSINSKNLTSPTSSSVYPLGSQLSSSLVPGGTKFIANSSGIDSFVLGATDSKSESSSSRTPNNENKPKWLKIGK